MLKQLVYIIVSRHAKRLENLVKSTNILRDCINIGAIIWIRIEQNDCLF